MPWVNRSNTFKAWARFIRVEDNDRQFERFLADMSLTTRLCGDHHTNIWLSDHAAGRVNLLLGPHYWAIIKAWQAKQGSDSNG